MFGDRTSIFTKLGFSFWSLPIFVYPFFRNFLNKTLTLERVLFRIWLVTMVIAACCSNLKDLRWNRKPIIRFVVVPVPATVPERKIFPLFCFFKGKFKCEKIKNHKKVLKMRIDPDIYGSLSHYRLWLLDEFVELIFKLKGTNHSLRMLWVLLSKIKMARMFPWFR